MFCARVQVTAAVRDGGWDGKEDTSEASLQWSFPVRLTLTLWFELVMMTSPVVPWRFALCCHRHYDYWYDS